MSKESKGATVEEIFEKIPVDRHLQKNIAKLPADMPEEVKNKLINDSKFWADLGLLVETPEEFEAEIKSYRKKTKALKGIKDNKVSKAYPNYDEYIQIAPPADTKKWLDAVKQIYYNSHKGKGQALENVIAGWNDMEKLDFKNWLKFYEENTHNKYSEASSQLGNVKLAQVGYWEDINRAGYFVPIHKDPENLGQAIDFAKDPNTNSIVQEDSKREIIERQRSKIVSRLDSAEKLLRSQEGQTFAGKEFEALIHIIYELKKKIHTTNKISTSTKLYEDMIVREANILTRRGFARGGKFLLKYADDAAINTPSPSSPAAGGGLPGTPTEPGPANINPPNNTPLPTAPTSEKPKEEVSTGMINFLDGLSGNNDALEVDDDLEVNEADSHEAWVVEAQVAPAEPEATPPAPEETPVPKPTEPKAPKDENLEVEEDKEGEEGAAVGGQIAVDDRMEKMFQGITIDAVVQKLEDISKIYKTRQLPRELSYVDMMLDHLGLAPFFPELAEATNKSLDANQYVLTRLENMTSRLRGTVQTNEIDLKGQNAVPSSPELESARTRLQDEQDKDKARKDIKKQQQDQAVDQSLSPAPDLEVEEDLGEPAAPPAAAPAPAPPAK